MIELVLTAFLVNDVRSATLHEIPADLQVLATSATVRIINPVRHSKGSGVVLRKSGPLVYILTASHVVKDAQQVEIHTFSAASHPKPDKVYRSVDVIAKSGDSTTDLALIRLSSDRAMAAAETRICPVRLLPTGENFSAVSAGCSGGRAPSCQLEKVRCARLVRKEGDTEAVAYWEVDQRPARGRSGGPLFDQHGNLLGICGGSNGDRGYYCHVEVIQGFLKQQGLAWLLPDRP